MDKKPTHAKMTIFHCINVFTEGDEITMAAEKNLNVNFIKLPCSSMVKDVFLMRAFEAGADVVGVLVCPEGSCRYVEGNLRAKKRIQWVKDLLDEIGVGGKRLALFNAASGDVQAIEEAIGEMYDLAVNLGPNPAAVAISPAKKA
jgi:F420-non-reducing hydrogenase iron-sulfur subunit